MKYTRKFIVLTIIPLLLVFGTFIPKAQADITCQFRGFSASAITPTTITAGGTVSVSFSFSGGCSGAGSSNWSCGLASASGTFPTVWKSFSRFQTPQSGTLTSPPIFNNETLNVSCYGNNGAGSTAVKAIPVTVSNPTTSPVCFQSYSTPNTYTYTPPAGATKLRVFSMVGGGGGGGFAGPNYSGSGGGGAQAYKLYDLPSVGSVSVVVGAPGTTGSPGGNGGNSSVTVNGFTLTAYGGKGGGFNTTFTGPGGICGYSTSPATSGGAGGTDPSSIASAGGRTVVCPSTNMGTGAGENGQSGSSVSVPVGGASAVKISGGAGGGGKWYGNFNFTGGGQYGAGGSGGSTSGGSGGSFSVGVLNSSFTGSLGWNGGGGASAFGNGGNGGAPSGYTNGPFDTSATGYGAGGAGQGRATGGQVVIDCVLPTTATINVTSNLCTTSGLAWKIAPGAISGSGTSGTYFVTPASGFGTSYSITPTVTSGAFVVSSSQGTSNLLQLKAGDNESFDITCAAPIIPTTFSLSAPAIVTVQQGGTITVPVTSTLKSGTSEPISFSLVGFNVPNDGSKQFIPQPCPTTSCTENIRLDISPTASLGLRTITVSGVSSPSSAKGQAIFKLNIVPALGISVSCSASPSPAFVGQPVNWTSTVIGNVGTPSYVWSGDNISASPAPSTSQIVVVYQTVGNKNASVTVTDNATSKTAFCSKPLEVRVNPKIKEF